MPPSKQIWFSKRFIMAALAFGGVVYHQVKTAQFNWELTSAAFAVVLGVVFSWDGSVPLTFRKKMTARRGAKIERKRARLTRD